jgi:membrane protein YqaA with SNARE-associated domain
MKNKRLLIIFLVIILTIILLVSLSPSYFGHIIKQNIKKHDYLAIFIFTFLSDFIDQPLGPELIAVISLWFRLNFIYIGIVSLLGTWSVSLVNYYLGKKILSDNIESLHRSKKYQKAYYFLSKHEDFGLLLSAILPIVPYTICTWLAGAFKMKIKHFLLYGMLPRVLRTFFVMLVFYLSFR